MMWGRTSLPDGLPRLNNYAQALSRYESTTPLTRGEDAGLIPLGDNRRYKRSQMLKVEDRIICRYWSTDVLTFKSDGSIEVFVGYYHSPTTLMFLTDVMGDVFMRYKGKIYYRPRSGEAYKLPYDESMVIKDGIAFNPKPEDKYVLNRAKMKEVQQRFTPFIAYCKAMVNVFDGAGGGKAQEEMKLLVQTYGEDYFKNMLLSGNFSTVHVVPYLPIRKADYKYRPQHQVTRHTFFEKVEEACKKNDLDLFYPLYFILLHNSCNTWYNYDAREYNYGNNPKRLKKYFDELVKFQYPNIFDKEVQPLGSVVSDSNAKYIFK